MDQIDRALKPYVDEEKAESFDELIEYLEFAENHYFYLAELMQREGKLTYYHEHIGKVKFIKLLMEMFG